MNCNDLNTLGLILDVIGVVLLFFFGLTNNISKEGTTGFSFLGTNEKEVKKWKVFNIISIIGFTLIISGFLCQIASNYPKIFCP